MASSSRIAVTATALVTGVGHTTASACAAIRSGVSRPSTTREFYVLDRETQDLAPLSGFPVTPWLEGFHGVGRWMRLARMCLTETESALPLDPAARADFWLRTAIALVTRPLDPAQLAASEAEDLQAIVLERFLRPLCELAGFNVEARQLAVVACGPVGVAKAVQTFVPRMQAHEFDRVLVIAVDSWFEPFLVERLLGAGRLKSDEQPVGLAPGEAAACVLLETTQSAQGRSANVLSYLGRITAAQEAVDPVSAAHASGPGLAQAVAGALHDAETGFSGDVFLDLNGEPWRAHQWGTAAANLRAKLVQAKLHLPATSIGDTGAASGAVGICLASESFRRGWAKGDSALVVSSAEWGETACVRIERGLA